MEITSGAVLFAFTLTVLAGLSTGIGSVYAFFSKSFSPRFLAASLGFSAGVMIYVSLVEIFPKAQTALAQIYPANYAYLYATLGFFCGVALAAIIDRLIPLDANPHEMSHMSEHDHKHHALMRMGVFTALAVGIHNFPEGLATFIGALQDPTLGVSIAIAIAIHNIPEGIAVSVPLYYATKDKWKAFKYSFLSGLAEPVGAAIGFLLLMPFMNGLMYGAIFAGVAGIMVYISLDELLPAAEEYGEHHVAITGVMMGMAVMALSLVLLQL